MSQEPRYNSHILLAVKDEIMDSMPTYELAADSHKQLAVAFVVGLLVGAGAVWVWSVNTKSAEAPEKKDPAEEVVATDSKKDDVVKTKSDATIPVLASSVDLAVSNQLSGNHVNITSVTFPEMGGWVVIHEVMEGELGNALGAQFFSEGSWSGTVSLLRNTVVGNTYAAVLYGDNGDRQFTLESDKPLTDRTSSQVIMKFFVATAE